MKINWSKFDENSSERDAVLMFAGRIYSFKELILSIWSQDAKIELKKLKKLGAIKARKRARSWYYRYCDKVC
jgi:hypothetical protein